jgi:PAS domain S-box-containing protein
LASYRILDTGREALFDRVVELAASIFQTPIALVSLIDAERQWFKAKVGMEATETPRAWAFCNHAIAQPPLFVVPDATREPCVADSPLVTGPPGVRFYAGAVIESPDGQPLGTVCVMDRVPRGDLAPAARDTLRALARLAQSELERRRVTMEAAAATRRFQDFVETSADWYWEMDEELRFTTIAGNLPDMPLKESFIGKRRWEAHAGQEDAGLWARHRADLEARRTFRDLEIREQTKDGRRIDISISGKPVFDDTGRFLGYRGTSREITRRVLAQEAMERGEENFRAIFERHPDPMWVVDPDSLRFLLVNDAAIELYGFSRAEFLAMRTPDIPLAEEQERLTSFLARLDRSQESNSEWRHRTRDGRTITVLMRGQAIRFDGRPARLIVARDITALKQAESELAHQQALLQQSQRLEVLGQLTGGVAHDFNNLLTVILGNAELLQEGLEGKPALHEIAATTRAAAERAAQLTARLLAFARRQSLVPQATDVGAVVAALPALLRRTLSEDIEVQVKVAEGSWPALVDQAQLESAVLNLCINARDAMPDGGRLVVELANRSLEADSVGLPGEVAAGDYLVLSVSDSGSGMSEEVRARAFEPFFTTKDVGKGSGLGLSMVYGFVKQSGGHVSIYSELGRGTTVRLFLPRAASAEAAVEPPPPVREVPRGAEAILLVEDDEMVRGYVARQLDTLGYRVTAVDNGPAAVAVLASPEAVDLLLTDMVMPGGMNGRQLAEAARVLRPGIRIVVSSGYTESAMQTADWQERGLHILSKPYRRRDLADKLRQVLSEPPLAAE